MKEKIKKILRKIMIKCVLNYLCDFILMCMAYVYPANAIAIHNLMNNPYSMMFLHFGLYRISIIIVNIIKQLCIMNNNHD